MHGRRLTILAGCLTAAAGRAAAQTPGPPPSPATLSGVVRDVTGAPIPDAEIRLIDESFAAGFPPVTHVIQIVDDDHRGITLTLRGLPSTTRARDIAAASGYGVSDLAFEAFDRRMRAGAANPVLGPGALFRANRVPLDFLLASYRDRSAPRRRPLPTIADRDDSVDDGDCLLIDGRRAIYQPLWTFTSQEVQLVEVLCSTTRVDEFIESAMNGVRECGGTTDRHPTYFMLWTRALR